MRIAKGDLWQPRGIPKCIPTNGEYDKTGKAIMGAGLALQAKERYPEFPKSLGEMLRIEGNHVHLFYTPEGETLITFPTKIRWKEKARIDLILQSAKELVDLANLYPEWKNILLPRVGCGLGGLKWEQVKPLLERILDKRFIVVYT